MVSAPEGTGPAAPGAGRGASEDPAMQIRTFAAGDDLAQVGIYNEAGVDLPKFKPATLDEVRRRNRPPEFDPTTRFIAVEGNRPVGYAGFHPSGRVSFPWTRRGFEAAAEPLFERLLSALKERGIARIFAAYRGDWPAQRDFFLAHGFEARREVVNYVMDLAEMPTPAARASSSFGPVTEEELPAVFALAPKLFRARNAGELGQYLLQNPYFPGSSVFGFRPKAGDPPLAIAIMIDNAAYANPKQVDSAMPCFRAGAFGTEGLQVKRMNGLFAVAVAENRDVSPLALDLLGHATFLLQNSELETLCAQVTSDATQLVRFYKQYFRRQGSFPLYEREL
jgi:hypothetical protein